MSKKRKVFKLLVFIAIFLCVSISLNNNVYAADYMAGESKALKQDEQFKERIKILKQIIGENKINEVALAATVLSKETAFDAVGSRYNESDKWQKDYESSIQAFFGGNQIGGDTSKEGSISANSGATSDTLDLLTAAAIIMADSSYNGSYNEEKYKEALASDTLATNNPILDGIFCGTSGIVNGVLNIGDTAYKVATGDEASKDQTWYNRQNICDNGYVGGVYNITETTEPDPDLRKAKKEKVAEEIIDFIHYYCKLTGSDACKEKKNNACTNVGSIDAQCSGVTVGSKTLTLEEYVAGVIKGEFGGSASNDENRLNIGKVNAIAARSFLMAQTGCTSVISGPSFQVYKEIDPNNHYDQIYLKAAEETAGIVMVKNDKFVTGYFVTVPVSRYITKSGGNWTFHMLGDANDQSTAYDYTMPEADIFRIASYTGGLLYPSESSGHHWGIPTVGAAYEVEKGTSTDEILKMFYGQDVSLAKMSSSTSDNSSGLVCDGGDGDYVDVDGITFESKNYNIEGTSQGLGSAFDFGASNVSQCPWYAKYRAIEIIESSSLSNDLKEKAKAVLLATLGNGNQWYAGTNSMLSYFKYSNDITKPKAGSIISWNRSSHNYGHVAIVEKVNDDGSIVISEGWNRFGANSGNSVDAIKIITRTITPAQIQTYDGSGSFIGYTYLFSYKE